jgi:hypothetical protein
MILLKLRRLVYAKKPEGEKKKEQERRFCLQYRHKLGKDAVLYTWGGRKKWESKGRV